jgi:hypothetical protein
MSWWETQSDKRNSNFSWLVLSLEFPVSRDADKGEFLDANAQEI